MNKKSDLELPAKVESGPGEYAGMLGLLARLGLAQARATTVAWESVKEIRDGKIIIEEGKRQEADSKGKRQEAKGKGQKLRRARGEHTAAAVGGGRM